MIPEGFIQDLLARVDIVDVVGKYVQLRKGGANLLGLCPFHNEKSPSFTVSPTKQFYHCFGCGAHGTAISFLIEHTGASFPEAVRSLAGSVGLVVPEEQRTAFQQKQVRQKQTETMLHQQVLEKAHAFYLSQLRTSTQAIAYLKQRGLSGQTAKRFGLGWSGTNRQGLKEVFANYEEPILLESGLVIESEDGRRYDRFRERIMFPIFNAKGKLIGFGGRIIGKGEPKYLNSPETPVFSKGLELYGLWENRQGIRAEGFVLVVEGYMDVVGLSEQGMHNAVATLGTATTPQHIQKLIRASDRIVFSFDGDNAGKKAAWRALQTCLPLLRDDVSIRFLFLPPEHDPDSYIREFGADAFREKVQESVALSSFMLQTLAERHPLNEAEGRAACLHEARPLMTQIPESGIKTQIGHDFARLVSLTSEELLKDLALYQEEIAARASMSLQPQAVHSPVMSSGSVMPSFEPSAFDGFNEDVDVVPFDDFALVQSRKAKPYAINGKKGSGKQVTPLAKRLLRLLAMHPVLVDQIADQQLEVLSHSPHLGLVREFISLAISSGARHMGALLQAVDEGSDLYAILSSISVETMDMEELPHPVDEWNDALQRIEMDTLRNEQAKLVQEGLNSELARQRYQALNKRILLLSRVVKR
ncbi:DNA primase [Advenella faeciporci]|uniref:DNA primase n=1 Tax=Advenella faeciporci TaxID=797535 RepID=A0A918MTY1_9BURK|nr:DNA primase [Advenella faeciporci]GGW74845.1 DNA primase [Advenella faeciporci]